MAKHAKPASEPERIEVEVTSRFNYDDRALKPGDRVRLMSSELADFIAARFVQRIEGGR